MQTKITENLKRLPLNERELFLREEGKRKRIEMKEVRQKPMEKMEGGWRGENDGEKKEHRGDE